MFQSLDSILVCWKFLHVNECIIIIMQHRKKEEPDKLTMVGKRGILNYSTYENVLLEYFMYFI